MNVVRVTVVVLLVVAIGVALYAYLAEESAPPVTDPLTRYTIERTVKYGFVLQNDSNKVVEHLDFWAYAPVRQTEHQWVQAMQSNLVYRLDEDAVGNQRMHFAIDVLPPFATKHIDVTVKLRLANAAVERPDQRGEVMGEQPFVELADPQLQRQAQLLRGATNAETARQTFEWVKSAVKNRGFVAKDRGARYALSSGQGDCSEHMYLTVALHRINGLPARGIAGFIVEDDGVLKASRLHNWSQVQVDDVWHVVDADNGLFSPDPSHYLAMRALDRQSKFLGDGSQQLFGRLRDVSVRMN